MQKYLHFLILIVVSLLIFGCSSQPDRAQQMSRTYYQSWEKDIGYAQVFRVGNTLHLSGITGEGETLEQQLHHIYQQIQTILTDFNATTNHISKEVIYTTNMALLKAAISQRKRYYANEQYPSASWVQVTGLYSSSSLLEVAVTVELNNQ